LRRTLSLAVKILLTVGAFWLLLTHQVRQPDGTHASALRTILDYLPRIDARTFWTFVALAALVKSLGILSSMARWHLLLCAQGIRFPFLHIAGSFLIGRFIGTFLPSTIGLDGYKLYDAARFSGRTVEAAAPRPSKALGISGSSFPSSWRSPWARASSARGRRRSRPSPCRSPPPSSPPSSSS
jgi:hypothetical protein